ncbi:hypothetical protein [Paenibacillus sp. OAS669]|uniref:hypothetical protein n=1 Tax=Paenibacillus sp. OAS669 TaxID=2663821 RepID=UPI00178A128A|nr:hypothetical protein [Paenibacillus sp. OAS669]MBE1444768.1 hypothetical protein [Paenibacillus sp. OAS669]
MSRSRKHAPVWTDHHTPGTRWAKRQANKAVRRYTNDLPNGKGYRKVYNPWNICDYRFFKTKQQAIYEWVISPCLRNRRMSEEEAIRSWLKWYVRK